MANIWQRKGIFSNVFIGRYGKTFQRHIELDDFHVQGLDFDNKYYMAFISFKNGLLLGIKGPIMSQ